ncbi:hypothetical protein JCM11491_005519 [Sporobolomyces phaffii]
MSRAAEHSPLLSTETERESMILFPPTADADADADADRADARVRLGFYLFSIASEVWVIAAGTLFLPVIVETYARAHGRLGPDYSVPCRPSAELAGAGATRRCAVRVALFGYYLDTAAFALGVYSTSVAVQALTVISIGALADDLGVRHALLLSFATAGSVASVAFVLLPGPSTLWPLCTVLALVANVSFGATSVCLNSYLPAVASLSPDVTAAKSRLETARAHYRSVRLRRPRTDPPSPSSSSSTDVVTTASQSLACATDDYRLAKSTATSHLSSRAIALGYAAGISVLVALVPLVEALAASARQDETWPLRVAIAISGAWWFIGSCVAARCLNPSSIGAPASNRARFYRPMAVATAVVRGRVRDRLAFVFGAVRSSWTGLGHTLREWRRLPMTFVFLSAWFLLSDSYATLTSTAMLFAKTTLGLATSALIVVAILTPLAGIAGALAFPALQARASRGGWWFPRSNLAVLVLLVALSTLIPLYGLVALTTARELYLVSVAFGFVYGSVQSYSRTVLTTVVPATETARWFAVYSITDKASSCVGPFVVSVIADRTGELRNGFAFILAAFVAAVPILVRVDLARGTRDAEAFERRLVDHVDGEDDDDEFELDRDNDDDDETI